ncbi:hypothetical protein GGTG_00473 [Gaeumannomyces tritici R3-111a-1]|uniref:Uncharacterized protein n=1 Tax=Gaeumannomyces tritici (strain R3-111a-1) TaxID=644352 RepID=J3NGT4_GAET3|nr:hypothetical protein GGTG_00473 [Gaeumannomyces tritici R3-111a-1]EJT80474.1 hypothetical protein GGTG_00473 [Gaeumannomyces tritici R3-111a-1]
MHPCPLARRNEGGDSGMRDGRSGRARAGEQETALTDLRANRRRYARQGGWPLAAVWVPAPRAAPTPGCSGRRRVYGGGGGGGGGGGEGNQTPSAVLSRLEYSRGGRGPSK